MNYIVVISQVTAEEQRIVACYAKEDIHDAKAMLHQEMASAEAAVKAGTLSYASVTILSDQGRFISSDCTLRTPAV